MIIQNRIVQERDSIANFVFLIAKQYIYRQKCIGQSLLPTLFKAYLKNIERMEKYIGIKNKTLVKHVKKSTLTAIENSNYVTVWLPKNKKKTYWQKWNRNYCP